MIARRLVLAAVVWLCVSCGALVFVDASAFALNTPPELVASFGSTGSGAGQFSSPRGVAVDALTHDVYVADTGNRRVDEFSASGSFVRAWGWGVADGVAAFETCTSSCEAGLSGSGAGQFTKPAFVAVDNSGGPSEGDVYVGDPGDGLVTKFEASGELVSGWGSGGQLGSGGTLGTPIGIAVNTGGSLLVLDESKEVFEFSQEGSLASEFEAAGVVQEESFYGKSAGLAVNGSGELFKVNAAEGSVEELTSTGGAVGQVTDERPLGSSTTGLAVEPVTGELYVGNSGREVEVYVFPSRGKVSTPEGTTCAFENQQGFRGCGQSESFGSGVLQGATGIGVDSSDGAIFVADAAAGRIDVFQTPVFGGVWASDVSATSATLAAQIDPSGSNTEYRLEYGPSASYGQTLSGNVGEGRSDVLVSDHRQELLPGTTYHYRIVLHSGLIGTIESPDQTFTTQGPGGELTLPDGRVWELVSPASKQGALIEPFLSKGGIQAAAEGGAIAYLAYNSLGEDTVGKGAYSQVISVRGANGWSSRNVTPPPTALPSEEGISLEYGGEYGYQVFSPDLGLSVVESPESSTKPLLPPLSPVASERTPYLHNGLTCAAPSESCYTPLVSPADVPPGTHFADTKGDNKREVYFVGASHDLRHVVVESPFALTPEAVVDTTTPLFDEPRMNLYEWGGGRLQLVNVLPDGQSEPGVYLGMNEGGSVDLGTHAISDDGRWVVWSYGSPALNQESGGLVRLFVRDMVGGRTVQVGGVHARFQSMSSDGSRVFFLENGELYVLDTGSGTQTDLTADHGGEPRAGVQEAVVGTSEDGSYVYFVAKGALANGAVSGGDNVYVAHDTGSGWSTTYIATLSSDDEKSWFHTEAFAGNEGGVNLGRVSSRVSQDGRYVAFMSDRSLTGYDNNDAFSGQPDEEVYLYDAQADRLVCVSCNPTGARPTGVFDQNSSGAEDLLVDKNGTWAKEGFGIHGAHWVAGIIPSWFETVNQNEGETDAHALYQPRFLSDSGRLFFDSSDSLVPQATNGLMDVYEFEPEGVGSCVAGGMGFVGRSGGCVSLISAGTSSSESAFYDASENGSDVFFVTSSKLVGEDFDTSNDVYDAHACSSESPCIEAPVSSPSCATVDSCKAAPSPQPEIFGPAPSATFNGAGNVTEETKRTVKAKTKAKKKKLKKKKRKVGRARRGRKSRAGRAGRAGKFRVGVSSGKGVR